MSTSLSYEFCQALATIACLQVDLVEQLIVAGVGLDSIFVSSGLAFMVMGWAGARHLVWMTESRLIWPPVQFVSDLTSAPKSTLFTRAISINVTNSEVFVFYPNFPLNL